MVCIKDCGYYEECVVSSGRLTFAEYYCNTCGVAVQTEELPPKKLKMTDSE